MIDAQGYAAQSPTARSHLTVSSAARRANTMSRSNYLFCGVCHSDLHTARNEWNNTLYPSVPGHEIVGRVSAVGSAVSAFKVGDLAGVGCWSTAVATARPAARNSHSAPLVWNGSTSSPPG
ncbi:hypothetical protein SSTU70S_05179 [Stutzerimonas stutzeri]